MTIEADGASVSKNDSYNHAGGEKELQKKLTDGAKRGVTNIIGIYGLDGSFRRKLATLVVRHFRSSFPETCFWKHDSKLCKVRIVETRIYHKSVTKEELPLPGKKVFIILNDATHSKELDILKELQFGLGSIILILTKDRKLLVDMDVDYLVHVGKRREVNFFLKNIDELPVEDRGLKDDSSQSVLMDTLEPDRQRDRLYAPKSEAVSRHAVRSTSRGKSIVIDNDEQPNNTNGCLIPRIAIEPGSSISLRSNSRGKSAISINDPLDNNNRSPSPPPASVNSEYQLACVDPSNIPAKHQDNDLERQVPNTDAATNDIERLSNIQAFLKASKGSLFKLIALGLELASAVSEQTEHPLLLMIIAIVGLAICITDLGCKARREKVRWHSRRRVPWFYSSQREDKIFGSLFDYFTLLIALWQCGNSTASYVLSLHHLENPIKMSVYMILLYSCALLAYIAKQIN